MNPGPPAPQAGVIIRTRRRAPDTGLLPQFLPKYETEIIKTLLTMQTNGLKEGTLRSVNYQLKYLERYTDLIEPEKVKAFISQMKQANSYKQNMVKAYNYFADINGLDKLETLFKYQRKIPLIPTSENVNKIISASTKKYATIFRILDETGLEGEELATITKNNIDEKQGIINAQGCKGHKSRSFKLKPETAEMLRQYLNRQKHTRSDTFTNEKPFPPAVYMSKAWIETRNKLAIKLQQPEIKKIPLRNLRHKFATLTYDKTKDMFYIMQQMGHTKYETTLFYAQLIHFDQEEEYTVKVASDIKEATELIAHGFEYITEIDGLKLFRKRK